MAPKINGLGIMPEDTRICVVMVGLPARGKSYIAQRGEVTNLFVCSYLAVSAFTDKTPVSSPAIPEVALDPGSDLQRG